LNDLHFTENDKHVRQLNTHTTFAQNHTSAGLDKLLPMPVLVPGLLHSAEAEGAAGCHMLLLHSTSKAA